MLVCVFVNYESHVEARVQSEVGFMLSLCVSQVHTTLILSDLSPDESGQHTRMSGGSVRSNQPVVFWVWEGGVTVSKKPTDLFVSYFTA